MFASLDAGQSKRRVARLPASLGQWARRNRRRTVAHQKIRYVSGSHSLLHLSSHRPVTLPHSRMHLARAEVDGERLLRFISLCRLRVGELDVPPPSSHTPGQGSPDAQFSVSDPPLPGPTAPDTRCLASHDSGSVLTTMNRVRTMMSTVRLAATPATLSAAMDALGRSTLSALT